MQLKKHFSYRQYVLFDSFMQNGPVANLQLLETTIDEISKDNFGGIRHNHNLHLCFSYTLILASRLTQEEKIIDEEIYVGKYMTDKYLFDSQSLHVDTNKG